MTAGKNDPRYAEARARCRRPAAARRRPGALGDGRPEAPGRRRHLAAAAGQVAELSVGLCRLYAGSKDLRAGSPSCRRQRGTRRRHRAAQRGRRPAHRRPGRAPRWRRRARDRPRPAHRRRGRAAVRPRRRPGPAGQLVGGSAVPGRGHKFRGDLPSTKDLEQLQRESPGLFDSGYFVLAAIQGAPPANQDLASFAVNLDRGGNAGQIVVVPGAGRLHRATRELGEDLQTSSAALREGQRHRGRRRRPGRQPRRLHERDQRAAPAGRRGTRRGRRARADDRAADGRRCRWSPSRSTP